MVNDLKDIVEIRQNSVAVLVLILVVPELNVLSGQETMTLAGILKNYRILLIVDIVWLKVVSMIKHLTDIE